MAVLARVLILAPLVLAGLLLGLPAPGAHGQQHATPTTAPRVWLPLDAFYESPATLPATPGELIRSEPLTDRLLPAHAQAWRILYTTTLPDGTITTGVATVLAPAEVTAGPHPVVLWEHGTVGILQKCMPSVVTAPFEGVPALDQVVAAGWVLVAPDYAPNAQGVHPYVIGEGETASALDAVRAARQMPELNLTPQTVVCGHSQGGHAALWTGILGPEYAPDVNIVGVAALAPASNMERILTMHGGDSSGARLGAYIATAYSQYFPDVKYDDIVSPSTRTLAPQIADLCQFDPVDIPILQALTAELHDEPVLIDPAAGALGERLRENAPNSLVTAPLFIAQGLSDVVIDPVVNDDFVKAQCAAGQSLVYWHVPGRDHGGIVAQDSPLGDPLIAWTQDRFAGAALPPGCFQETTT